jgi:hypothetical protein
MRAVWVSDESEGKFTAECVSPVVEEIDWLLKLGGLQPR